MHGVNHVVTLQNDYENWQEVKLLTENLKMEGHTHIGMQSNHNRLFDDCTELKN